MLRTLVGTRVGVIGRVGRAHRTPHQVTHSSVEQQVANAAFVVVTPVVVPLVITPVVAVTFLTLAYDLPGFFQVERVVATVQVADKHLRIFGIDGSFIRDFENPFFSLLNERLNALGGYGFGFLGFVAATASTLHHARTTEQSDAQGTADGNILYPADDGVLSDLYHINV